MAKRGSKRGAVKFAAVDLGHANLRIRTLDGVVLIPHALIEMSDTAWLRATERVGRGKPDYVRVNNRYFVVGDTAQFHGVVKPRMRADRYERDYYGVLMCSVLARLYSPHEFPARLSLFASHPIDDSRYADKLVQSLAGDWVVELAGSDPVQFTVEEVQTYDEAVGGLANVVFTKSAKLRKNLGDLMAQRVLVIDIGAGTTQVLPVMPGFDPDYLRAGSFDLGIMDVLSDLEKEIRETYRDEFQRAGKLQVDRLQEALLTNTFIGGGHTFDVGEEVQRGISRFLNDFHRVYHGTAGGPMPYDQIALTGGGPIILGALLINLILEHGSVFYADGADDDGLSRPDDRRRVHSELHLANVTGGLNMMRAFIAEGIL